LEIVERVDESLHGGARVTLYIRSRSEPITVTRVNRGQFSVRIYTDNAACLDLAYSAVESARYSMPPNIDLLNA